MAVSVLLSHGIVLGGYKLLDPLTYFSKNQTSLGDLAVMGFFTLSGYLITSSFVNLKNVLVFASHRLLRILPGFWVSLFVTAFILAPIIFCLGGRKLENFNFTGRESAASFFTGNIFLNIQQWSVKDVLSLSAYNGSLNGSLWSLFPEFQCYCFTVLAGTFGLFQRNKILLLLITIAISIFFAINFNFSKTYGPTILILSPALKLYTSYLAGTFIFVFRDKMMLDKKGTFFLLMFTLMLIKFGGYNILSPFLIAMTLINAFQLFEFKLKYDISYGIYIYSFPAQHLLYKISEGRLNIWCFLGLSFLVSAGLGIFSYLVIERPFIKLRNKTDPALQSVLIKISSSTSRFLTNNGFFKR